MATTKPSPVRKKILASARANSFSDERQQILTRAISSVCDAMAEFFDIDLRDMDPAPIIASLSDAKGSIAELAGFYHLAAPAPTQTTGEATTPEMMIAMDKVMINNVASLQITGRMQNDPEQSDEAVGSVEKRLATAFAVRIAQALSAALCDTQHDLDDATQANGAKTPPLPFSAALINDPEALGFSAADTATANPLTIQLTFDVQTKDGETLGAWSVILPADTDTATHDATTNPGQTINSLSFDALTRSISLVTRAVIAAPLMPLDRLLAMKPGTIIALPGASINDITLCAVDGANSDVARGALGACDGVRAVSITGQ